MICIDYKIICNAKNIESLVVGLFSRYKSIISGTAIDFSVKAETNELRN